MKAHKNPWLIVPAFFLGVLLGGNSIASYFDMSPSQELVRSFRSRVNRRKNKDEFNLNSF